jgi:hypothetical protein
MSWLMRICAYTSKKNLMEELFKARKDRKWRLLKRMGDGGQERQNLIMTSPRMEGHAFQAFIHLDYSIISKAYYYSFHSI